VDLPIEVTSDGQVLIRRKDLAMKIYGELINAEVEGGDGQNLLLGIPNAKKFAKYLTVVDEFVLVYQKDELMEKLHIVSSDTTFEVILSSLSEPDVSPMKLEGFFIDTTLDAGKVKLMFEVMKLINSEECGMFIANDGEVYFRVGGLHEDKGKVKIAEVESLPEFNSKYVTQVTDGYFIKFHHQDILNTLSVLDKSNQDTLTKFRLKPNGAMVITEETADYIIHFGFVPYV
jgi:hypothetical protein